MTDDDTTHADAVLVSLLGSAEGTEARAIMRAAVRADLMWRCPCQQANYLSHETCAACSEPRRETEAKR